MKKIGIVGGGQLGLMISQEVHRLGAFSFILDPSKEAPAFKDADYKLIANFDDLKSLRALAEKTDVLSYEFENIPAEILQELNGDYQIPQGIQPLLVSQDRLREKDKARQNGLKTTEYIAIAPKDTEGLKRAIEQLGYPSILKTRTLGYDGRGQVVLRSAKELAQAEELLTVPCLLEKFLHFDYECSIILIRSEDTCIHFPIAQNIHKDGILDLSVVPCPHLSKELEQRIIKDCQHFMTSCGFYGILAIELFVKGNDYYFNEMAPRPHNSGHYTMDGCTTNQFRELSRFLLGEKLVSPQLIAPTIMKNILGEDLDNVKALEDMESVSIHLYGKTESRPKRKMGHINFTNTSLSDYQEHYSKYFKN